MTFAVSVTMSVAMTVSVAVTFTEERLSSVVVACVSENAVLDVAAEEALLGERHSILKGIVSPTVHTAEEKWSGCLAGHVLIQVVLEELPLSRFHS